MSSYGMTEQNVLNIEVTAHSSSAVIAGRVVWESQNLFNLKLLLQGDTIHSASLQRRGHTSLCFTALTQRERMR